MPGNIVGPHGPGVNETTTRPTDTASGNPLDTWFKDCNAGVAGTGTKVPAVWLNKVCALFRQAIRGRTLGPEPVELDDDMLLKCFRDPANIGDGVPVIKQYNTTTRQYELRSIAGANGVTVTTSGDGNKLVIYGPSPEGDPTTGANLGDGAEVYKDKVSDALRFRSLVGVNGVAVTEKTDTVEVGLAGQTNAWIMVKRQRSTLGSDVGTPVGTILADGTYALWSPTYTPQASGNVIVVRGTLRLDALSSEGGTAGVARTTIKHGVDHNASGSYADLVPLHDKFAIETTVSSVDSAITVIGGVVPVEGDISPSPATTLTLRVKGSAAGLSAAAALYLRAGSTLVFEEYAYKSIGINAT